METNQTLEDQLIAEFAAFIERTGFPKMSADELWCELLAHECNDSELLRGQRQATEAELEWLETFSKRWEAMENACREAHRRAEQRIADHIDDDLGESPDF
jgi:hypothetical protein